MAAPKTMTKANKQSNASDPTSNQVKPIGSKRPISEIDDIFATAKSTPKITSETQSASSRPNEKVPSSSSIKSKQNTTNVPSSAAKITTSASVSSEKSEVKTIVFTDSSSSAPVSKKPKMLQRKGNDDDDFADSRGKKSSKRYTEDGYPIYDAKDLGIGLDGGETSDCPFDCKCCF